MFNYIYWFDCGLIEWLMIFCMGLVYVIVLWCVGMLWVVVGLYWGWNLVNGVFDLLLLVDMFDVYGSNLFIFVVYLLLVVLLFGVLVLCWFVVMDVR